MLQLAVRMESSDLMPGLEICLDDPLHTCRYLGDFLSRDSLLNVRAVRTEACDGTCGAVAIRVHGTGGSAWPQCMAGKEWSQCRQEC